MSTALDYKLLLYRGNFSLERSIDFSESFLSARYANGYREDVIVGSTSGLRGWRLTYSALHRHAYVELDNGAKVSRHDYVWNFFVESKSAGNQPFLIRDTDGGLFLCVFSQDKLTYQQVDHFLSTSGLEVEQISIKGVAVNADGSVC